MNMREQLGNDLMLLAHAEKMLGRTNLLPSKTVLIRAIIACEDCLGRDIRLLGGMAGEW